MSWQVISRARRGYWSSNCVTGLYPSFSCLHLGKGVPYKPDFLICFFCPFCEKIFSYCHETLYPGGAWFLMMFDIWCAPAFFVFFWTLMSSQVMGCSQWWYWESWIYSKWNLERAGGLFLLVRSWRRVWSMYVLAISVYRTRGSFTINWIGVGESVEQTRFFLKLSILELRLPSKVTRRLTTTTLLALAARATPPPPG